MEDTIWVVNVLSKSAVALLTEAQVLVHVAVLMVASEHKDLFGVLQLQSHQKTNYFERLATFIDVVAQEEVVIARNVARIAGRAPNIKEAHHVDVVAMDVSKNLDWRLQRLDHDGLSLQNVGALTDQFRDLFSLQSERGKRCHLLLTLLRLQQFLNEHGEQRVVGVLLHEGSLHVGTQFFGLFLQVVDRNFSNKKGEVLRRRVHLLATLSWLHRDMGLVCELEFRVFADLVNVLVLLFVLILFVIILLKS